MRRLEPPLAWYGVILVCLRALAIVNVVLRKAGRLSGYGVLALWIGPAACGSSVLALAATVLCAGSTRRFSSPLARGRGRSPTSPSMRPGRRWPRP